MRGARRWSGPGVLAALVVALLGCGPELAAEPYCEPGVEPRPVAEVLWSSSDPCLPWVRRVYGRVLRTSSAATGGRGSAALWSSATAAGTGVLVTAAHVMTPCVPILSEGGGDLDGVCPGRAIDPEAAEADVSQRLAEPGTGLPRSEWSPAFPLAYPELRPGEPWDLGLPPRRDFSVYAIDDQLLPAFADQPRPEAGPLGLAPPPVDDPDGLLMLPTAWGTAVPGDAVLLAGYPERTPAPPGVEDARRMEFAVGTVLSDAEARAALAALAEAGDEEGAVPYDPQAEVLVRGHALPGMSGGGVFDTSGALVAIMVRASVAPEAPSVVRAVRMSHVVAQVADLVAALDTQTLDAVARRLPPSPGADPRRDPIQA